MNDEFGFASGNPKFNELIKKYQAVDEITDEQINQADEPLKRSQAASSEESIDFEKELDSLLESVQEEAPVKETDFTFDPQVVIESEAEQDFSYDLDKFGVTPKISVDLDDVDDSWLDASLDESLFYRPAVPEEEQDALAAAEAAQEPVPEEPVAVDEEPEVQESAEVEHKDGGYIAESAVDRFAFDDDTGFGFDDEEPQPVSSPELDGLPIFTPVRPDKKGEKQLKKKKETKAVTGFSKRYKPGEEEKAVGRNNFFIRNFVVQKGDSTVETVRKVVMSVAVIVAVCSALYLFNEHVIVPYRNDKSVSELNEMLGDGKEVADSQSLSQKYPDVEFPKGMLNKYAELYAANQDLVGWVEIEALGISLPVVKGEDNSQYISEDFDGKKSRYGTVFMNSANDFSPLNYNTTLFGHHMKDGKMFANLSEYKSVEGYKKAPVIEFNTLFADYKWKVFAVFITNGTAKEDEGYLFNYMFTDLSTNKAVEDFLGEVKLRSLYYPKVDLAVSDKILTLSTCTYEFDEARLIVMARMVRPGESEAVDTSEIRFNPNPRYPAAYYEKNGLNNPYADYSKWQPS